MFEVILEREKCDRQHRIRLQQLLKEAKGLVRIASPYVTDTGLLMRTNNKEVRLLTRLSQMDIISGASSLESLSLILERGVKCRCIADGPRLHAKVYISGEDAAVVTSANLTRNALDFNIEVGVQLSGNHLHQVILWFDELWERATVLDLETVHAWQQETEALRREYSTLRKKANTKLPLPNEARPGVNSIKALRAAFDEVDQFFVCNTNRKYDSDAEEHMRRRRFAAAWEDFRYPTHMQGVKPGNVILMYAKRVGIIGIGRARAPYQVLEVGQSDRIEDWDTREWRIPVEWLAWVENDADAFQWQSPNPTFFDASGDHYGKMREGVRGHFLGHPQ